MGVDVVFFLLNRGTTQLNIYMRQHGGTAFFLGGGHIEKHKAIELLLFMNIKKR